MTSTTTASLTFSPGPLGLELEPVWQAGGKSVGCRVAGFKSSAEGIPGQAETMCTVKTGDILTEVNGLPVRGMFFEKVIYLLRRDANRAERHLSFRSSLHSTATATASSPQQRTEPEPGSADKPPGSGIGTPNTTPSPEPHPPPAPPADENEAAMVDRMLIENEASRSGSVGWAMSLLGIRRQRGQEADGIAVVDDSVDGDSRKAGASLLPTSDTDGVASVEGVLTVDAEEDVRSDGTETRAAANGERFDDSTPTGAASSREEEEMPSGGVLAPPDVLAMVAVNGKRGEDEGVADVGFSSHTYLHAGADFSFAKVASFDASSPKIANAATVDAFGELPDDVRNQARADENVKAPRDHGNATDIHDGEDDSYLAQMIATAIENNRTIAPSNAERALMANGIKEARPLTSRPVEDSGPSVAMMVQSTGGLAGMITPDPSQHDEEDDSQSLQGGAEATDKSLDTISLRSESVSLAGKNGSAGKRRWVMVPHLWGGRSGPRAAGGSPDISGNEDGEGDGEVEEARRLARSLAAKLNERARRCEELEDVCGLRDDQVSMLQRQNNSLAERAAMLSEQLLDRTALADALQHERSRLDDELSQERTRHQEAIAAESALMLKSAAKAVPSVLTINEADKLGHGVGLNRYGKRVFSQPDDSLTVKSETADSDETLQTVAAAARAGAAEVEAKAKALAAAAEARAAALQEMVDGFVSEKVQWEEERAARSLEAVRLRAQARGLEDALAVSSGGDGDDNNAGNAEKGLNKRRKRDEGKMVALRELLRSRTRELEAEHGVTERLAARVRELQGEVRQLNVSLTAREGDVLACDREMQVLSDRLHEELREKDVAVARAEAEAEELRQALWSAEKAMPSRDTDGSADGRGRNVDESSSRSTAEKVQWVEERTRLQHNLLSLQRLLQQRDEAAKEEDNASTLQLKIIRDGYDRAQAETVSLRKMVELLHVELSEALSALAEDGRGVSGTGARESVSGHPLDRSPAADDSRKCSSPKNDGAYDVKRIDDEGIKHNGGSGAEQGGGSAADEEGGRIDVAKTRVLRERNADVHGGDGGAVNTEDAAVVLGSGRSSKAVQGVQDDVDGDDDQRMREEGVKSVGISPGVRRASGPWLGASFEGSVDELQLDLMEKDIVIEQLRAQVKQLRARIATLEDEQAADTVPLKGLLTQLGELKGTVQEREEREQQCRDQVDRGLLRMERLKEENAMASPPVSLSGSAAGGGLHIVRQVDESHQSQVEQQRLRRQIDDLNWEMRTLKRHIEERETQLRDARADADIWKNRTRVAERALAAAQGEAEVAATEGAAERRRAGTCRAEVQVLRAELRAERERTTREGEERQAKMEADARSRVAAAVAAAESAADDRVAALKATLEQSSDTLRQKGWEREREQDSSALESEWRMAADVEARTRKLESAKCALAAREVELEAIVDATAGFSQRGEIQSRGKGVVVGGGYNGGGSDALRGALAAVAEARRVGGLAAELEEECNALNARVTEGRSDVARLQEALQKAKVAEEKAEEAAATAVHTAAAAVAASRAAALDITPKPEPKIIDIGKEAREQAEADHRRAVASEDALGKALTGAEQAWRLASSCLVIESELDDGNINIPLLSNRWRPKFDAGLAALVETIDALARAHRERGDELRRTRTAVRTKTACAREARRREAGQLRAREDAEARLQDALAALEECSQHAQNTPHWGDEARRPGVVDSGAGRGGTGAEMQGGSCAELSQGQIEHLRQIRSEVDRLEGQNRQLRQSLVGGPLMDEPAVDSGGTGHGGVPTQRALFSSVVGSAIAIGEGQPGVEDSAGRSDYRARDGLSGSEQLLSGSAGSPSPSRSWSAAAKLRGGLSQWGHLEPDGFVVGKRGHFCEGVDRGFENCSASTDHRTLQQDDRSGGTMVPGWQMEA